MGPPNPASLPAARLRPTTLPQEALPTSPPPPQPKMTRKPREPLSLVSFPDIVQRSACPLGTSWVPAAGWQAAVTGSTTQNWLPERVRVRPSLTASTRGEGDGVRPLYLVNFLLRYNRYTKPARVLCTPFDELRHTHIPVLPAPQSSS